MLTSFFYIVLLLSFLAFGSIAVSAQGADGLPVFNTQTCEDLSRNLRETCFKMRIDKEKKDYDEMLARGEEVRRLSERLEKSFAQNGRLSDTDRAALETVERNVRKIRGELGGDDDDEKIDDLLHTGEKSTYAEAVGILKNTAVNLAEELKKTTRFTISATAIQTSNAVLTIARFLRVKN